MNKHICRAKDENTGDWIYGYVVGEDVIVPIGQSYYLDEGFIDGLKGYSVDPNTVCRCIGWQDSCKTPIFERDVVEFNGYTHKDNYLIWWCNEMSMITAVPLDGIKFNGYDYWNSRYPQFEYSTFCIMMQDPWGDFSEVKVVGNIYDNPELLEV